MSTIGELGSFLAREMAAAGTPPKTEAPTVPVPQARVGTPSAPEIPVDNDPRASRQ